MSPGKVGQVLLPDGAWVIEEKVKFTVQSRSRKRAGPDGVTLECVCVCVCGGGGGAPGGEPQEHSDVSLSLS